MNRKQRRETLNTMLSEALLNHVLEELSLGVKQKKGKEPSYREKIDLLIDSHESDKSYQNLLSLVRKKYKEFADREHSSES